MAAGNRYQDLLSMLPQPPAQTYSADGEIIPYLDAPHQFQITGLVPNRVYGITFNSTPSPNTTADVNGVANVFSTPKLPPGLYDIGITDTVTQQQLHYFTTVKNIATWYAAYAEILNNLDAEVAEMDQARSLDTVTSQYIQQVYGQSVRQPFPSTFFLEDYRNYLRQLRFQYRHFGAHPYGLSQAVEGMTSVSPFVIPQKWRPHWILGTQICENNDFQTKSRGANALYGPAGAVAASVTPELPNINRQSRYWVSPSVTASLSTGPFRVPPRPQQLTVTLGAANQYVTLTGVDESGLPFSEQIPDPSVTSVAGTYASQKLFANVTSAIRTPAGGGAIAQIGIVDKFVKLVNIGDQNAPGVSPVLAYHGYNNGYNLGFGPIFSWGGGINTGVTVETPFQGYGLSLIVESGGFVRLSDATVSFTGKTRVGNTVTISGAQNAGNNGTFPITTLDASDSTDLHFANPNGVDETADGTHPPFHWLLNPSTTSIGIPFGGSATLLDMPRVGVAVSRIETSSTISLDPVGSSDPQEFLDRLYLELADMGTVKVKLLTNPRSPTNIAADVNAAFNADARYGAGFSSVAAAPAGTQGDSKHYLLLSCPAASALASNVSRVKIHPGPADGSELIFGLPLSSTHLTSTLSGYTLVCADTSHMPAVSSTDAAPYLRRFKVRIRGLRFLTANYTALVTVASTNEAIVTVTGYTFTPDSLGGTDTGGYLNILSGAKQENNGMHQIVGVSSGHAIVRHEYNTCTVAAGSNGVNVNTFAGAGTLNVSSTSGFPAIGAILVTTGSGIVTIYYSGITATTFTGCNTQAAGAGVLSTGGAISSTGFNTVDSGTTTIWGKGEVHTVVDNNVGTNTLTLLSTEPAPNQWQVGATVELVNETPYAQTGTNGLGSVDIVVDERYRPYHDFGDSISFVSGTTWRLTSARGPNFTSPSQVGVQIVIEGCTNLVNNSPVNGFTITAVHASPPAVDFVNASAIAETSNFEWHIDSPLGSGSTPQASATDTVLIIGNTLPDTGADLPDGWKMLSSGSTVTLCNNDPTSSSTQSGLLVPSRVVITTNNPGHTQFIKVINEALAYAGLPLNVTFWLQEHTADATVYSLDVSFDGTNFWNVASQAVNATALTSESSGAATQYFGPLNPSTVEGSFFVPYNASTVVLRMTRTPVSSATGTMSIEKMVLRSVSGNALALGDNTIPRNQKRSKFGEVLYVWSAENLIDEERIYLGLPIDGSTLPSKPGHIDYITNAHGYYDRLDISEVDDSGMSIVRNNIRGVYDSIDWVAQESAGNLINMDTVIGTPSRLSYARPHTVTFIAAEALTMADGGSGTGVATLTQNSNHDGTFPQNPNTGNGTSARLYEIRTSDSTQVNPDGSLTIIPAGSPIPVPDTLDVNSVQPWWFTAENAIKVGAVYFNPTSQYALDYEILMRVTTSPFELGSGENDPTQYVWLIDFARWARHNVTESSGVRTEQANFQSNFTAVLNSRADITQAATLIRDTGTFIQTVGVSDWSFQDSKTIQINSNVFDRNSIYSISYVALVPSIKVGPNIKLEWRASGDMSSVTSATWQTVDVNDVISPFFDTALVPNNSLVGSYYVSGNAPQLWHQMRCTLSSVEDVRDCRIYGLGVKGIRLDDLGGF